MFEKSAVIHQPSFMLTNGFFPFSLHPRKRCSGHHECLMRTIFLHFPRCNLRVDALSTRASRTLLTKDCIRECVSLGSGYAVNVWMNVCVCVWTFIKFIGCVRAASLVLRRVYVFVSVGAQFMLGMDILVSNRNVGIAFQKRVCLRFIALMMNSHFRTCTSIVRAAEVGDVTGFQYGFLFE